MSVCRLNINSYDVTPFRFQHIYDTVHSEFLLGASIFRRGFRNPICSARNPAIIEATHYLIMNPQCNSIKQEIGVFFKKYIT